MLQSRCAGSSTPEMFEICVTASTRVRSVNAFTKASMSSSSVFGTGGVSTRITL